MHRQPRLMGIQQSSPDQLLHAAATSTSSFTVRATALCDAIDAAAGAGQTAVLEEADAVAASLIDVAPTPASAAEVTYFRANVWAALRRLRRSDPLWDWEAEETQRELLHLREAAHHRGFEQLDPIRQCQIDTNLGCLLGHAGRIIDGLASWDRALARIPRFAMALGNRGYFLSFYARLLYDRRHATIMLLAAFDDLTAALDPDAIHDNPDDARAVAGFAETRAQIARVINIHAIRQSLSRLPASDCGSEPERFYRSWCLHHRLFLNPLNDLGTRPVADQDVFATPSFVTTRDQHPTSLRFFNIMKQEYVSARWMFFEGSHSDEVHFSDRGVLLYNTLDYPSQALAVERIKAAFRSSYSLFDKIGQFVNHYWGLGIKRGSITLRRVWYEKLDEKQRKLRTEFLDQENWPLRGLCWLSRDLFDPHPGFRDHTDPDAQAIAKVRHRLEHGFLAVHEFDALFETLEQGPPDGHPFGKDPNLYPISRRALTDKTLRLLQLARAALIYLSLAMHREEQRRAAERGDDAGVLPLSMGLIDDDWKR